MAIERGLSCCCQWVYIYISVLFVRDTWDYVTTASYKSPRSSGHIVSFAQLVNIHNVCSAEGHAHGGQSTCTHIGPRPKTYTKKHMFQQFTIVQWSKNHMMNDEYSYKRLEKNFSSKHIYAAMVAIWRIMLCGPTIWPPNTWLFRMSLGKRTIYCGQCTMA